MRRHAEALAHAAALVLLAWALIESVRARPVSRAPERATASPAALAAWSSGTSPSAVHGELQTPPSPEVRDWLRALRRSGTPVTWSTDSLIPLALDSRPIVDPSGGHRIAIAAPPGTPVLITDDAGVLDTVRVDVAGAWLGSRTLVGAIDARTPDDRGRASVEAFVAAEWKSRGAEERAGFQAPSSGGEVLRDVLVLGGASWEARFVIAALEEAGWRVTARIAVAPETWVEQGQLASLDTSRYRAVVVLDTTARRWGDDIARFVANGGGVVIAGSAAAIPALRAIAPGGVGRYIAAPAGASLDSAPRRALGVHPVVLRASDGLALERHGSLVTLAARRHRLGRVLQLGHDDTWRWRMAGGDGAPADHREWWTGLVRSVAHVSAPGRPDGPSVTDAAPVAHLLDALGAQSAGVSSSAPSRAALPWWMLALGAALLLTSWGSRRLRGAP